MTEIVAALAQIKAMAPNCNRSIVFINMSSQRNQSQVHLWYSFQINYLGINLTKEMEDLYAINY